MNIDINQKVLLGIDYGTKVVGTALFSVGKDPYPLPFERIIFKDEEQVLEEILFICENELVDILILGLPLHTDGKESEMTKQVREFSEKLKSKIHPVPVIFQDETLTTFEAEERMKSSPRYNFKVNLKEIDSLSASIILEDFLKSCPNS